MVLRETGVDRSIWTEVPPGAGVSEDQAAQSRRRAADDPVNARRTAILQSEADEVGYDCAQIEQPERGHALDCV